MAIFIKEVVTDDANTFSFKLVMGCFDYKDSIYSKYLVAFFRKKGLADKNGKVLNGLAGDVNKILRLLYPKYRIEAPKHKLLFNALITDGERIAITGQYYSSCVCSVLHWIIENLIYIHGSTAFEYVNSILNTMIVKSTLEQHKTFTASIQGKARQGRSYVKCLENAIKQSINQPTNQSNSQPTGQVDNLPKIEGVWMGKERIGGSRKRKAQIGSIVLSFTRVVSDGKEKYRLDKIEGAYSYDMLPVEYSNSEPAIFMERSFTKESLLTHHKMIHYLTLPNGSALFETGKVYTQNFLVAKLQYLVKAGQRLRDIKRDQAKKEKVQKATWKGSFVVQV